MNYFEIAIAFIIGVTLILLLGWIFSLKTKGLVRLLINALAGAAVLILLTVFKVVFLPLNPLSALIVGFMGVPGLIVVYIITVYL